jgi:hypothetical protein
MNQRWRYGHHRATWMTSLIIGLALTGVDAAGDREPEDR